MSLALIPPRLTPAGTPWKLYAVLVTTATGAQEVAETYEWNLANARHENGDGVEVVTHFDAITVPSGKTLSLQGVAPHQGSNTAEVTLTPDAPGANTGEVTLAPGAPGALEPEVTLSPGAPGALVP